MEILSNKRAPIFISGFVWLGQGSLEELPPVDYRRLRVREKGVYPFHCSALFSQVEDVVSCLNWDIRAEAYRTVPKWGFEQIHVTFRDRWNVLRWKNGTLRAVAAKWAVQSMLNFSESSTHHTMFQQKSFVKNSWHNEYSDSCKSVVFTKMSTWHDHAVS